MKISEIEIGQKGTHPSTSYILQVVEFHKIPEYKSDYIQLGKRSNMIYSGLIRCGYLDEKGNYKQDILIPENELTILPTKSITKST